MEKGLVGKYLSKTRRIWGLSQKEMATGVISTSQYSKIERGLHDIGVETLSRLLLAHGLSMSSFFEYADADKSKTEIYNKIIYAQNNKDVARLDEIYNKIDPTDKSPTNIYLQAQLVVAYLWVTGSSLIQGEALDNIKRAVRYMMISAGWSRYAYSYLNQLIILYNIDEGYQLITSAYHYFRKNRVTDNYTQQCMALAIINYINLCWRRKADVKYIKRPIKFLREMPLEPAIGIEQILATYYEALFDNDEKTKSLVVEVLKKSGCYNYISDIDN